jgi:ADP-ribose pyrophosphatase YjhB (NUDIX family)
MADSERFSHCGYCGHQFRAGSAWPRACLACGNLTYRSPQPVAVVVVPVGDEGVLLVRRATEPPGLALPSGFIEYGEDWRNAAAREVAEETGVRLDPRALREIAVRSGTDETLLVFSLAPAVGPEALSAFVPSCEVSELVVAQGPVDDLVFENDAEVLTEWSLLRDVDDSRVGPSRRGLSST